MLGTVSHVVAYLWVQCIDCKMWAHVLWTPQDSLYAYSCQNCNSDDNLWVVSSESEDSDVDCTICGETFSTSRQRAHVLCSPQDSFYAYICQNCNSDANRWVVSSESEDSDVDCIICGETFSTSRPRSHVLCSPQDSPYAYICQNCNSDDNLWVVSSSRPRAHVLCSPQDSLNA